jgi:hypothetical protein
VSAFDVLERTEVALRDERAGPGPRVPSHEPNVGIVVLVVPEDAGGEAVHEREHGRDRHASERSDHARPRGPRGEVPGQERALVDVEAHPEYVRELRWLERIDHRELLVRILLGGLDQAFLSEVEGDDHAAALVDERMERGPILCL